MGIAGGVATKGVSIGDVLVSDQVVGYEHQRQYDDRTEIRWNASCVVDKRLIRAVQNFFGNDWQKLIQAQRPGGGIPKRHIGTILSGNKVIASKTMLKTFLDAWPQLVGVEMEAAGVGAAAYQMVQSPRFFMVRGVSDLADEGKDSEGVKQWRQYACDVAASYAIALLQSGPVLPLDPSSIIGEDQSEPDNSQGSGLDEIERNELADLLVRSDRTRPQSRRTLCIRIGVGCTELNFLADTSDRDFAVQLIEYLHNTGNYTALDRLCGVLKQVRFGGPMAEKLNTICARLG